MKKAKEKYRIKKLWSDNGDCWVYYIEYKSLFWHRVQGASGTWYSFKTGDTESGLPVTSKSDPTKYFKSEEEASDYILKHYTENNKTVRIFQVE